MCERRDVQELKKSRTEKKSDKKKAPIRPLSLRPLVPYLSSSLQHLEVLEKNHSSIALDNYRSCRMRRELFTGQLPSILGILPSPRVYRPSSMLAQQIQQRHLCPRSHLIQQCYYCRCASDRRHSCWLLFLIPQCLPMPMPMPMLWSQQLSIFFPNHSCMYIYRDT